MADLKEEEVIEVDTDGSIQEKNPGGVACWGWIAQRDGPTDLISECNDSELRTLLTQRGWRVPYYTSREELERLMDQPAPHEPPLSRIESLRHEIMNWAAENWHDIYYQVECPLQNDGCVVCPDFTVVGCLVRNQHIFDTQKEVDGMAFSWNAMMVSISKSDPAQCATLLRSAVKEAPPDTKANRLALKKIATVIVDIVDGKPKKPITSYLGLRSDDFPDSVKAIVDDADASIAEIMETLASVSESGAVPSSTKDKPKSSKSSKSSKQEKPAEEPAAPSGPFPGVVDASSVPSNDSSPAAATDDDDDDDDDDYGNPVAPRNGSEPLPPNQDAASFAKPSEAEPVAEEAPPTPSDLKELVKEPTPSFVEIPESGVGLSEADVRRVVDEALMAWTAYVLDVLQAAVQSQRVLTASTLPQLTLFPTSKGKRKKNEIPEMGDDDDDV